jgi:hypothetical protein
MSLVLFARAIDSADGLVSAKPAPVYLSRIAKHQGHMHTSSGSPDDMGCSVINGIAGPNIQ